MKYIEVSQPQMARLRRVFNVSRVTVWSALTYQTKSDLANRIRTLALSAEMGGRIVKKIDVTDGFCPDCQTTFVRNGEGTIVRVEQLFEHDVKLVFDCKAETVVIERGGVILYSYVNVDVHDWAEVAWWATQVVVGVGA